MEILKVVGNFFPYLFRIGQVLRATKKDHFFPFQQIHFTEGGAETKHLDITDTINGVSAEIPFGDFTGK